MTIPSTYEVGSTERELAWLHQQLGALNRLRVTPVYQPRSWEATLQIECELRRHEARFIEEEREQITDRAHAAPTEHEAFVRWFEALSDEGPGQHDTLFPWLADQASMADMKWFLRQELAGEAGFDDLVALTQVRMPSQAKLELARNYWDEMGQGQSSCTHHALLMRLAHDLSLQDDDGVEAVWETLALSNLMLGLAANRHYAYQAIGALGVIELTAPERSMYVNAGLRRLGVPGAIRRYYALHAALDKKHSEAWNREVLRPLVARDPRAALPIAEGALMRLTAGARCYDRYRRELLSHSGVRSAVPAAAAYSRQSV